MKVLIVDDEEHVREGIEFSITWEKFGVKERLLADNGIEALDLIRLHHPAVVFCDMKMPVMNGIELLEKIREEEFNTQVIVVSGYSDFEFTRAAIKANGIDYILKPIRRKEMEEAMQRAVDAWNKLEEGKQEEARLGAIVRKADALLDEEKLVVLAKGDRSSINAVKKMFGKIGLPESSLNIVMILPKNRLDIVSNRFMMDDQLFFFAINNIVLDAMGKDRPYYLCRLDEYQWLLVTAIQGKDLAVYLNRVRRAWKDTLGLEVLAGECKQLYALENISEGVGEARKELLNSNVFSGKPEATGNAGAEKGGMKNYLLLLKNAIETGNKHLVSEIVKSYADSLCAAGVLPLKELQLCSMEANLMLGRLIAKQKETLPILYLPLWISDLNEWKKMLVQQIWILMEIMSKQPSPGYGGIEEIRDYLHAHFEEEISLTVLSEKFHFSPQYISKKFKETCHSTIITYVTELRIGKAKTLLRNTQLSVSEIASQVGYADENYFSKAFKKQVGVSPLLYRKTD